MKLLLRITATLCLILCTHFANAAQSPPVYYDPKTPITVSAAQPEFAIRLKSNPTTGFSWTLKEFDSHIIEVQGHRYLPPTSQLVGAGGYEIWSFKVKPVAFTTTSQSDLRFV